MDGNEVVRPDELVELEVVHVTTLRKLWGVQDHERVVGVHVHLGDVVTVLAVPDGQWVEAEYLGQQLNGLLIAGGDVDPDEPVLAFKQRPELVDGTLLDAGIRDQANIHTARPLPLPPSGPPSWA
jgi:hypothetical protein